MSMGTLTTQMRMLQLLRMLSGEFIVLFSTETCCRLLQYLNDDKNTKKSRRVTKNSNK
jgi:hypothetical protein